MQQKIVACACIHKLIDGTNKVLVTKRSTNAKFLPGVYEIPGGHIEPGEDLLVGLKREIKEELNIDIEIGDIVSAFTYTHGEIHSIEVVYLASPINLSNIQIQEEEIDSYLWISEEEIRTLIEPNKPPNDQEIPILKKAFCILGNKIAF